MKHLAIPTLIATTLLSACAGDSLTPRSGNSFAVDSQPSGATVYVMGQEVGTTPLVLKANQVFPITYPSELHSKYGLVELRHAGCQPYIRTVSTDILSDGLKARLDCEQPAAPSVRGNVEERLRKLKEIYDKGLITEEEYRSKREAILQDL